MSELIQAEEKARKQQLAHQRGQSFMQAVSLIQNQKMISSINKLQTASENVEKAISRSIEVQREMQVIQNEALEIDKKSFDLQKREAEKSDWDRKYKLQRDAIEDAEKKAEKEFNDFQKKQKNAAFELKGMVAEINSSAATLLEKYYFYKEAGLWISEIEIEDFEISDKEYVRNTEDEVKKLLKECENSFDDNDLRDKEIVYKIDLEDEDEELKKIDNSLKILLKGKKILNELKDSNIKNLKDLSILEKQIKELKKIKF